MVKFKALAAGIVALGALAASPAAADGLRLGLYGPSGGLVIDERGARIVGVHGPDRRYRSDPAYYGPRWLRPNEVRRVLRRQGYEDIEIAGRRGRVYVVYATNRIWERLRLVVSARSGRVVDAVVVSRPGRRPWDGPPGYGRGWWDDHHEDRDRADRRHGAEEGDGRPRRPRG